MIQYYVDKSLPFVFLLVLNKTDERSFCSSGKCRRGEHGKGGVPGHSGGSGRELINRSSMWTASRCAAPGTGANTHAHTQIANHSSFFFFEKLTAIEVRRYF